MELEKLKGANAIAFACFAMVNAQSGLLANREALGIRGIIKREFNDLWKQTRKAMNTVDKAADHGHNRIIGNLKAELKAIESEPEKNKDRIQEIKSKMQMDRLENGYDQLAEDITVFLECWMQTNEIERRFEFMEAVKTSATVQKQIRKYE